MCGAEKFLKTADLSPLDMCDVEKELKRKRLLTYAALARGSFWIWFRKETTSDVSTRTLSETRDLHYA